MSNPNSNSVLLQSVMNIGQETSKVTEDGRRQNCCQNIRHLGSLANVRCCFQLPLFKMILIFAAVSGQEFSRLRYGKKVPGQIYTCFSCLVSAEKVRSHVQSAHVTKLISL